ncbi:MAG: permease prefix domain 1-containing protein [Eubacteriales bacterium]
MRKETERYIHRILQTVLNTKVHESIKAELNDHIESLVEEKMQEGLSEEDAVKESIQSIGNPKELGKQLNSIYKISKMPIVLMLILNITSLIILSFIIITKSSFGIIDILIFIFNILMTFMGLFFSIKYLQALSYVTRKTIRFTQQKGKITKSYIENLTNKIYIIGVGAFLILMTFLTLFEMIHEGINLWIANGFHTHIFQISLYANLFFMVIINIKYPKVIVLEDGIYVFVDLPKYILWKDIKDHKWTKTFGKYRLDICKDKKTKKIHGNFNSSDKMMIDHLLSNHQDLQ